MQEQMDAADQIQRFADFFEQNYKAEILEKSRKGERFLEVDFAEISKFDPELADLLLDEPDEVLKAAALSLEHFDVKDSSSFAIRLQNLPETQKIMIRNFRSQHLGRLMVIEGTVRQKSDVRPQVTAAKYECPQCGSVMPVLQLDTKMKEPNRCSCGRKGKFRLLSKDLVDAQGLVIEESAEDLEGGAQPKRINVFLKNDLVSPMSERKTNPGQKIRVVGMMKEVPIILRSGGQSTRYDLLFEANSVMGIEEDYSDIEITEEDEKTITDIAQQPNLWSLMTTSIAPSIYGHERIKEALVLQMMGGVRKIRDDGVITRGDMHVLLIGDPGAGKSILLKRISKISPKGRFISGKGVSGAGLTATVVKDEFLQGWSLEAGALVLAHKGTIAIDELDKMSQDDRAAMHEALEGQTVTISKANIQATLRCETTVLAAANPKFGRFDPYDTVGNQIDLPSTLINRFDLIFPIKDLPDEAKDEQMAKFILHLHQKQNIDEPEIGTPLLRKYFAYAKHRINPRLTDEAVDTLKIYYVKMRASGGGEGAVRAVPISARQLEGLIRMTEACARVRLSNVATGDDARRSIDLLDYCLRQVAFDEETGTIDIDKISSGITATQRNKIQIIKEIIKELEGKLGKTIPLEDVVEGAKEKNLKDADVEEIIQKLKRSGDIFEPRRGFISKI